MVGSLIFYFKEELLNIYWNKLCVGIIQFFNYLFYSLVFYLKISLAPALS